MLQQIVVKRVLLGPRQSVVPPIYRKQPTTVGLFFIIRGDAYGF
jgi:hypothetical protein